MDRDERRIRDEIAVGREQGTGEVEPLLDVRADRGLLQRTAHRFGNTHEAVRKEREQYRIWTFAILASGRRGRHG